MMISPLKWWKNMPSLFKITFLCLIIVYGIEICVSCVHWYYSNEKDFLGYVLQKIVYFTTQTSIISMIVIFVYLTIVAYHRYQRELEEFSSKYSKRELEEPDNKSQQRELEEKNVSRFLTGVLIGSLSISAIPTGISLTICAFYDINFIKYMSGVEIYIAFAGISIVSIGFLSTLQEHVQIGRAKGGLSNPNKASGLTTYKSDSNNMNRSTQND